MGVCTRLLQRKHCWTMKGSLLALTLLVGLWSIIIASSGESSNEGELKNIENYADALSRTIREAKRKGRKLKAKKGKKGKAKRREQKKSNHRMADPKKQKEKRTREKKESRES